MTPPSTFLETLKAQRAAKQLVKLDLSTLGTLKDSHFKGEVYIKIPTTQEIGQAMLLAAEYIEQGFSKDAKEREKVDSELGVYTANIYGAYALASVLVNEKGLPVISGLELLRNVSFAQLEAIHNFYLDVLARDKAQPKSSTLSESEIIEIAKHLEFLSTAPAKEDLASAMLARMERYEIVDLCARLAIMLVPRLEVDAELKALKEKSLQDVSVND